MTPRLLDNSSRAAKPILNYFNHPCQGGIFLFWQICLPWQDRFQEVTIVLNRSNVLTAQSGGGNFYLPIKDIKGDNTH